jgi:hypothetical protein
MRLHSRTPLSSLLKLLDSSILDTNRHCTCASCRTTGQHSRCQ